jgi:hypothetical protein
MLRQFVSTILLIHCVPVFAMAGDLEPNAPPGPTMRSLDEIPAAWSKRLDSTNGSTNPLVFGCGSSRFECVFSGGVPVPTPQAVLDKETGLVWQRSPDNVSGSWGYAVQTCHAVEMGGRWGWRLPTIEELSSLLDSSQPAPSLPTGHPFLDIQFAGAGYWTQTTYSRDAAEAWYVSFELGAPNVQDKSNLDYVWCVRGGHGSGGL